MRGSCARPTRFARSVRALRGGALDPLPDGGEEPGVRGRDSLLGREFGLERRDVVFERAAEDDAVIAWKHEEVARRGQVVDFGLRGDR